MSGDERAGQERAGQETLVQLVPGDEREGWRKRLVQLVTGDERGGQKETLVLLAFGDERREKERNPVMWTILEAVVSVQLGKMVGRIHHHELDCLSIHYPLAEEEQLYPRVLKMPKQRGITTDIIQC